MEEAEEVELDAMERMEKAMEVMSDNFATVRTGRANPNMLDRIEAFEEFGLRYDIDSETWKVNVRYWKTYGI